MDMDVDMDDAVPFSQEDWTNGEEEDMEWDAAVLEAALHELDHLRHGRVPEDSDATPRPTYERSILDTNDAGLSHADGGVMSTTHETGQSLGPRVVTIVPDTNVLVHEGGASLDRLLGRFRAHIGAEGSVTRARVAVPRKVVQELDGLKHHAGGGAGRGTGERRSEVAALARSVNRALERRLIGARHKHDHERRDAALDERDAELLVQGPADAGAMRVRMRAEGLERGGDEEIVYFCQRRRKSLGEVVVLLTADVNAAVTAASVAGPGDVPVCAFHPGDVQANDASALLRAARAFYADVEERIRGVVADNAAARGSGESVAGGERAGESGGFVPSARPPPPRAAPAPRGALARDPEPLAGGGSSREAGPESSNSDKAASPASHASRVLDALDAAFPPAVEAMLREDLGDMWAVAVRDDAEDILEFTPDDAFEALRKNLMTLVAGRGPRGGSRGYPREALESIAVARRQRRHGRGWVGDRVSALGVVAAACDVLACLPGDIPEVSRAAELAAGRRRDLAG